MKEEKQKRGDTAATALTAQIVFCVILILCAFAMKSFDPAGYAAFREQYISMMGDSKETDRALVWFSERGFKLGEALDRLKGYMPGSSKSIPEETPIANETDIDEPEDEPETPTARPVVPEYDYLGEYAVETVGAGGGFPVEFSAEQPPPENSTLAPVYLSVAMKPPVTGLVTSEFSYRSHPLTGKDDFHTGLDVAAAEGTPVLAALSGEVEETGWSDIYGNYIVLRHSEDLRTSYSHLSSIIAGEGMSVRQGERIALVGETGTATGPHLHFSVITDDKFADPLWVLGDYIRVTE